MAKLGERGEYTLRSNLDRSCNRTAQISHGWEGNCPSKICNYPSWCLQTLTAAAVAAGAVASVAAFELEMRLLTHNMLSSNIKGVANGFPLRLEATSTSEKKVEMNPSFLTNIFPKLDWPALVDASRSLGYLLLPDKADPSMLDDPDFRHNLHHALLEIHVEDGALICPETGRRFPINKGIPNMLLHEDEV